jgi:cell division protein FtsL
VAGVLLACGIVFALAGVHVLLTQGQFRLERLQRQDADAQAQYVRLRLEVAQLESPGRIVAEAQERLGMVPPNAVTYLTPSGPVPAPHPAASTGGAKTRKTPDTTQGWAAAKPALARRP